MYNANTHLLRRHSGRRLENLFWRMWGNGGRLCHVLSGATVARLFVDISEDGDIIRTTPIPSPRMRQRSLNFQDVRASMDVNEHLWHLANLAQAAVSPEEELEGAKARSQVSFEQDVMSGSATVFSNSPENSRNVVPPPPILKKSRLVPSSASDVVSPRVIGTRGASLTEPSREATHLADPSPSTTQPRPPTPPLSRSLEPSRRKRTTFAVGGSSSRRRPLLSRRKSSQSSSSSVPSRSGAPSSASETIGEGVEPRDLSPTSSTAATAAASTQESGPASHGRHQAKPKVALFPTLSAPGLRRSDIVQVEDRRRDAAKVENRRQGPRAPTSSNLAAIKTLPTLASSSTAALGTVDMGDGSTSPVLNTKQAAASFTDEVVPLKPAASSSSAHSAESVGPTSAALTRTKSQLALLLERDRQVSQGGTGGGKRRAEGSG